MQGGHNYSYTLLTYYSLSIISYYLMTLHPVATLAAKAGRQPVDFKAVPSSHIHPSSTMARGATRKAVPALDVRSRRPHGYAPRPRGRVLRGGCGDRVWEMTIEF